jgi:hypothetical protein
MSKLSDEITALLSLPRPEAGRVLRSSLGPKKLELLGALFAIAPDAAFDIGKRAALTNAELAQLVDGTIQKADASTIRWWLELHASGAGIRETCRMVHGWGVQGRGELSAMATYWLLNLRSARDDVSRRIAEEEVARLWPRRP